MAENSTQDSPYEEEIDLREIIKILIESKKLVISTILIFTTASIIYSLSLKPSFISSAKLEIGYYEMPDGTQKLIEKPSRLISDLKVLIMKNSNNKFNQNMSMNSFEGKLIDLETTSSSAEQNENLLTEIISYIDERHSNVTLLSTTQKKNEISHRIDLIESEISFLKESLRFDLEAKISKLKSDLPLLDQEISQLNQVVIEDSNNLKLLKNTALSLKRASNSPTLEQIISSYKTQINLLTREKNNSISDLSFLSQKLDALKKNTLQSDEFFSLEESHITLKNQLTLLENVTLQPDKLFKLEQEQKTLENQLLMLTTQTLIKTHPIGNIETKTIKPKTQLTIVLGLITGFIAGIFLVFIRNFVKSYKGSQA
jgi:uncharacterized protein involved in exopolysaccharide biosynthesis